MIHLGELQAAIRDGSDVSDSRGKRLLDALRDPLASGEDIAPLARQVLCSAAANYPEASLAVPARAGLAEACARARVPSRPLGINELRVEAPDELRAEWLKGRTSWLELATVAPGRLRREAGGGGTLSRQQRPVPADPMFTRLTGHRSHPMPEQREAVRQVALAPPGSVTHVVLPTGAGKTIVGVLPAIQDPRNQVIVVVPTVAIALDQERAIREASGPGATWVGAPEEVAWHGDLPQEVRSRIRDRLLSGTQRVLFTSPESMVTSLEPTLLAAANIGRLHTLVFDEAHLIAAWGLDFRPEMQLVASVRQQLLDATARAGHEPIRTVLLTATLDREALRLNASLFPSPDLRLVGAPALRTEPRFLRVPFSDEQERFDRLVDLLMVAPRPAIVYATKVKTAEATFHHLRAVGLQRVALFTGGTTGQSRREILDGWRGSAGPSRFDIVVGTAAFGLGVDQPDVRTVVHIESPLSIGAYYQEVGRGGRDGHACVSVLFANRQDLSNTAIADATIISPEKAWKRWTAMRTTLSNESPITVNVRVLPEHIAYDSERNELWNKNTLVLLERAGLLRLLPRSVPPAGSSDEVWEQHRERVALEFLQNGPLTYETIRQGIQRVAGNLTGGRAEDRAAVEELLVGQRCFGELFAEAYTFAMGDDEAGLLSHPTPACSGCPGCMRTDLHAVDVATAAFTPPVLSEVGAVLQRIAGSARTIVVHDDPNWLDRHGPELLGRLTAAGCSHLFLDHDDARVAKALDRLSYVALDPRPSGFPLFVRPSIIWRPADWDVRWKVADGPLRVIVADSGMPAPDRAGQTLEDWWTPARRARRLMEQL